MLVNIFWIKYMNNFYGDIRRLCLPNSANIILKETIIIMML